MSLSGHNNAALFRVDHSMNSLRVFALFAAVLVMACPAAFCRQTGHSQNEVAREVQHQLVTLPFYMVFDHLSCRVNGDTVTLLGQVTRPALKGDAEKAALHVPGIRRVDNEIEILPDSSVDQKLRLAEYLAIFGDPQLNQYALQAMPPIHIIVRNGAVTLEGTVATESDKTEAFTQASGVPGVISLTDHLQVGP